MTESPIRVELSSDRAVLRLPPILGVADGPALRDGCRDALESGLPVTVDALGTERLHTASLQCLLALATGAREQGGGFEWSGLSDELRARIELLAMHPLTPTPDQEP